MSLMLDIPLHELSLMVTLPLVVLQHR